MSKIISAGNPILKNVAAPVEVFDKKLKFLVIDMKKTRAKQKWLQAVDVFPV